MNSDKHMQQITRAIRLRRIELGYSQEYMAAKMGMAQNTYSKIELGNVKLTVERLLEISGLLNLSAADLIDTRHPLDLAG